MNPINKPNDMKTQNKKMSDDNWGCLIALLFAAMILAAYLFMPTSEEAFYQETHQMPK